MDQIHPIISQPVPQETVEAIQYFYKLWSDYTIANGLIHKVLKDSLTKDKRALFKKKQKCMFCKQKGITIFKIEYNPDDNHRHLIAKCGARSVNKRCKLNIDIRMSNTEPVLSLLEPEEIVFNQLQLDIIKSKNNLVFGLEPENEVLDRFSQYSSSIEDLSELLKQYKDHYYYFKDNIQNKQTISELVNQIDEIKAIMKDDPPGASVKLQGLFNKLRDAQYVNSYVVLANNNQHKLLVNRQSTLKQMEITDSDAAIISNIIPEVTFKFKRDKNDNPNITKRKRDKKNKQKTVKRSLPTKKNEGPDVPTSISILPQPLVPNPVQKKKADPAVTAALDAKVMTFFYKKVKGRELSNFYESEINIQDSSGRMRLYTNGELAFHGMKYIEIGHQLTTTDPERSANLIEFGERFEKSGEFGQLNGAQAKSKGGRKHGINLTPQEIGIWGSSRDDVQYKISQYKVDTYPLVRTVLENSGDKILVHPAARVGDNKMAGVYWDGRAKLVQNDAGENEVQILGENRLGSIWMDIRNKLTTKPIATVPVIQPPSLNSAPVNESVSDTPTLISSQPAQISTPAILPIRDTRFETVVTDASTIRDVEKTLTGAHKQIFAELSQVDKIKMVKLSETDMFDELESRVKMPSILEVNDEKEDDLLVHENEENDNDNEPELLDREQLSSNDAKTITINSDILIKKA
jgi:hypothetical protein